MLAEPDVIFPIVTELRVGGVVSTGGGGRGVGGLVVVFAVTKVWFADTEVLFDWSVADILKL